MLKPYNQLLIVRLSPCLCGKKVEMKDLVQKKVDGKLVNVCKNHDGCMSLVDQEVEEAAS